MSPAGRQGITPHSNWASFEQHCIEVMGKAHAVGNVYKEGAAGLVAQILGQEDFETIVGRKTRSLARYILDNAATYALNVVHFLHLVE